MPHWVGRGQLKSNLKFLVYWQKVQCYRIVKHWGVLTVLVNLASNGTTPWSVRTARFSLSLAILAMAAQMLASTSLFVDFSKLTISSNPPTRERTISPASCSQRTCYWLVFCQNEQRRRWRGKYWQRKERAGRGIWARQTKQRKLHNYFHQPRQQSKSHECTAELSMSMYNRCFQKITTPPLQ